MQGRTAEFFPAHHIAGEQFLRWSRTPRFDPAGLARSPRDRSDTGGAGTDQSNPVAIGKRATHQIWRAAQLEECDEPEGRLTLQGAHSVTLSQKEGQDALAGRG